MCGIAGIVLCDGQQGLQSRLYQMAGAISHRGPDGGAVWQNSNGTVGLAHRRLSVLDLSTAASQPLHYLHYTIVFNGEIYNYTELKKQLASQGYIFTTQGDTEVLPAAYDYWGSSFLNHLDGMFAFAIYDSKKNEIFIARDRFGEKPLYYHQPQNSNDLLLFASEMKALWALGLPKEVNNAMLLNYLTLGYVQNPADKAETFFKTIFSLAPGHSLVFNVNHKSIAIIKWYHPQENIARLKQDINEPAAIERFYELLENSVSKRLRSDVSVGTSLSGGIDSSAIIATIHRLKAGARLPANWSNVCFTATFPGFEKNEAAYAAQVANNFGLQQYTVQPSETDFIDGWERLTHHQEEPVLSSSVFTQYMVYKLAKQNNITVLLDGQGADEILGGYKKYTPWYLQQLLRNNPFLATRERNLLKQNQLLESWGAKNLAASFLPSIAARQLQKKALRQQQDHPYISTEFFQQFHNSTALKKPVVNTLEDILEYNTFSFGLEELLRYADRNSMAHGREVRLPFLNHELVEFVFSLPSHFKIRDGFTKWLLRQSMAEKLPENIVWRKGKVGFEPPQQSWMADPALKEMVMQGREKLVCEGALNKKVLDAPFSAKGAHDAANYDWRYLSASAIL